MKSFHSLASIYFIIISKTRFRIKLLNDHPWKQNGIDPQARNRFSDRLTSSSLIDYGGGEREASLRSAGGRELPISYKIVRARLRHRFQISAPNFQ